VEGLQPVPKNAGPRLAAEGGLQQQLVVEVRSTSQVTSPQGARWQRRSLLLTTGTPCVHELSSSSVAFALKWHIPPVGPRRAMHAV
jgi:hypothetical protein